MAPEPEARVLRSLSRRPRPWAWDGGTLGRKADSAKGKRPSHPPANTGRRGTATSGGSPSRPSRFLSRRWDGKR